MSSARTIKFSLPENSPILSRGARRARGVYYTPPELVEIVLELTLPGLPSGGTGHERQILDPACGAGEFLVGAAKWLAARGQSALLRGVDTDSSAAGAARRRLAALDASASVIVGDGLDKELLHDESFDVIVGNPPYVSIRELDKLLGWEAVEQLRERYKCARGNFDLYVLFIERALALLKTGGRCGLVVPNKWATLDYARACRELLLAHGAIEHVVDLAGCKAFQEASVYPHVLVFRKASASRDHAFQFSTYADEESRTIEQRLLKAESFQFGEALDVELRAETLPLGEVAAIACGTAGYAAGKIAARLIDCSPALPRSPARDRHFITSGNIHRYGIRLVNVRYMSGKYALPRLPEDSPELSLAKRRLLAAPKIVVAGMSRRLEAAIDMRGLALGVQVFAVYQSRVDLHYLLGLLNSKLLSYLFATRFAGKRLGGGYLAINKGQLARLPIRIVPAGEQEGLRRQRRIGELARLAGPNCLAVDAEIDRLVYELYRVAAAEVIRIEDFFRLGRAAA